MAYLLVRGGLRPLSYYRLGLFRPTLPWQEKKNFVSEEWYRKRMERLNLSQHRIVAWSKLVSHGVLKSFNVPTPPFLGVASSVNGQSCDGRPLRNAGDLADLVRRKALGGACFKLIAGNSGRGFLKVSFRSSGGRLEAFIRPAGPGMNLDDFWRHYIDNDGTLAQSDPQRSFGYLCEGIVDQHPALAALHADSVNTARVWMYQPHPGQWEMFGALLRMGVGGNTVDNSDRGGIGSPIDVDTGRVGRAVRHGIDYHEGHDFETFDTHPTTGARIEGTILPLWDQVLPLCRRTCSIFPYFKLMGLDVAFAPEGLVVIEIEADPHSTHQTYMGRGIRQLLEQLVQTYRD